MTHEEIHNNASINVDNESDALVIMSMRNNIINGTMQGKCPKIIEMLASVMDSDPIFKNIILTAIELTENKTIPELN